MFKTACAMIASLMILVVSSAYAGECKTNSRPETTPTSRFDLSNDTVTDTKTGLTWMRCAVGQSWDGTTCVGMPRHVNWQQAIDMARTMNDSGYAGSKDWRVPVVPELASIVELHCFNPRVNTDVFPRTPSAQFWTSMEKMGAQDYAYTLDFGGGSAGPTLKTADGSLRLVRGGPWWTPPQMP